MEERKARKLLFSLVTSPLVNEPVHRHIIYTYYQYERLQNIYFAFNARILTHLLHAEIQQSAHKNLVVQC